MTWGRLNLPNIITVSRIAACPVVFVLALSSTGTLRLLAFIVFLVAAFSDVWDGYLARKHGLVTDFGKLLDPIADKLLLLSTFIPFYLISHSGNPLGLIPWWGEFPIWVMVVIFGRELLITLFRSYAARCGVVIPAGKSGKYKALIQNFFSGGLLFWYSLALYGEAGGWEGGFWIFWGHLHGGWVGFFLGLALFLTVYSMLDYLWSYRALVGVER
jgi:CDP-diacylglycerol--glycerol-3-phosphate 3-phosphatidyltransferase